MSPENMAGYSDVLAQLVHYFKTYGYYVLFFGLLLENTVIVGLVLPGETILLAASFMAARGDFSIVTVFAVGSCAAFLGNIGGYAVGRFGGLPLVERFGRRVGISETRIEAAQRYFEVHGGKTVFIGRFASFIRAFVSITAGASKMPFWPFIGYTTGAVLVWNLIMCVLGFYFGQSWDAIIKLAAGFGWFILAVIVGVIFLIWWRRRR